VVGLRITPEHVIVLGPEAERTGSPRRNRRPRPRLNRARAGPGRDRGPCPGGPER